jgi:hypothetical protein
MEHLQFQGGHRRGRVGRGRVAFGVVEDQSPEHSAFVVLQNHEENRSTNSSQTVVLLRCQVFWSIVGALVVMFSGILDPGPELQYCASWKRW